MDSEIRSTKNEEQLIITQNGIFRSNAAITNVTGKQNHTLSRMYIEDTEYHTFFALSLIVILFCCRNDHPL